MPHAISFIYNPCPPPTFSPHATYSIYVWLYIYRYFAQLYTYTTVCVCVFAFALFVRYDLVLHMIELETYDILTECMHVITWKIDSTDKLFEHIESNIMKRADGAEYGTHAVNRYDDDSYEKFAACIHISSSLRRSRAWGGRSSSPIFEIVRYQLCDGGRCNVNKWVLAPSAQSLTYICSANDAPVIRIQSRGHRFCWIEWLIKAKLQWKTYAICLGERGLNFALHRTVCPNAFTKLIAYINIPQVLRSMHNISGSFSAPDPEPKTRESEQCVDFRVTNTLYCNR